MASPEPTLKRVCDFLQRSPSQDEDPPSLELSGRQASGEVTVPELVHVSEKNLSRVENVRGFVSHSHISPVKVGTDLYCVAILDRKIVFEGKKFHIFLYPLKLWGTAKYCCISFSSVGHNGLDPVEKMHNWRARFPSCGSLPSPSSCFSGGGGSDLDCLGREETGVEPGVQMGSNPIV